MRNGKLDILLIEDDQPQAQLIQDMLAAVHTQQYAVHHVHYLAQGLAELKKGSFDCVVVDLGLPDSKGMETALSVRGEAKDVPIVVLTVLDDEDAALSALKLDIQDYLVKGEINSAVLSRSIRYATHRKVIARQLAESEERLRFASQAAGIGMWHWDLVKDQLVVDDKTKELFGFAPDYQPTYDDFATVLHPDDRERVDKAVTRALAGKEDYSEEMRVLLPGGETRWIASKGRAHLDQHGKPLRADGINMDITARKQGEEALLLAKEEWERTFDAVPDLIAILGTDYSIVRVNAAMAERIGKKPELCIGLPCYKALHGTDHPPESCPHVKALAGAGQQIAEVYEPASDTYFLVSYTPLFDPAGNPVAVVHVARDITKRKLAEERIEQLNVELAGRAADLEAANRELEAFNYTAAHDLRQPLNIIAGYCQTIGFLCRGQISEDCGGYLDQIQQAVKRMSKLLDALLDFSRMSRVNPQRAAVDLSALARGVAKDLKDADPGRAATFVIADGIEVSGDPALLEIVLRNLLGNAWKYTANEQEAVIEFGVTEADGKDAFFVRDNGPGFDMAEAHRLFAPFQRLRGTDSVRGFGIGLATVQRIISRHGGRVWAEGVPGKGATFYFTLD